jgi:hypothetical protein
MLTGSGRMVGACAIAFRGNVQCALLLREAVMATTDELEAQLNLETGRISWQELQPFFAKGQTIYVAPQLDLIRVARSFVDDDSEQVRAWMDEQRVSEVDADQAREWIERDADMWAVVVKPWVLVQPAEA